MASNIFGNADDKQNTAFNEKVDTHSKAILTVTQRQKDLESKSDLINEKIELLDHNSITNIKKINNDIKSLRADIREINADLKELKDFNTKVRKQLTQMSTRDEVTKLEKYIDLWNPMDFATKTELQDSKEQIVDAIKEIIGDFLKGNDDKIKEEFKKNKNN